MHLGFIGAGRMARPMVRRLIGAGHEVCVLTQLHLPAPRSAN